MPIQRRSWLLLFTDFAADLLRSGLDDERAEAAEIDILPGCGISEIEADGVALLSPIADRHGHAHAGVGDISVEDTDFVLGDVVGNRDEVGFGRLADGLGSGCLSVDIQHAIGDRDHAFQHRRVDALAVADAFQLCQIDGLHIASDGSGSGQLTGEHVAAGHASRDRREERGELLIAELCDELLQVLEEIALLHLVIGAWVSDRLRLAFHVGNAVP